MEITLTGWLINSLLTFVPYFVVVTGLCISLYFVEGSLHSESKKSTLKRLRKGLILYVTPTLFLVIAFSHANRPKMVATPDQTYEQQTYESKLERKSLKEVSPVEEIEDSFEERSSETKKLFEY